MNCLIALFLAMTVAHSPFHILNPESPISIAPGETKTVSLTVEIPPKYFIYKDKTDLQFLNLEEVMVKKIAFPPSKIHEDPYFKKKVDAYEEEAKILVTFFMPEEASAGKRNVEAILKLQGCSESLCYPEESHLVVFNLDVAGEPINPAPEKTSLKDLLHTADFSKIAEQKWWIGLAIIFLGGFLTSLTPCVLPLIPITLLIIGVRAEHPLRRNLLLSCSLVLGLALTYSFLGVLAVALGKSLGFVFQQKWFVIVLAFFFFSLSLSMFGLYEIHLPRQLRHRLHHIKGHGILGAFASGMAAGLLAAPCAGPVIGSLLIYVATTQNYLKGFVLLFLYALGMGLLFVVLGTSYGTFKDRFKGFSASLWVKRMLGVLLLSVSLFYVNSVIPFEKGFSYFWETPQSVAWVYSEQEGLALARKENKIILLDFYAEWCAPCKELDIGFFRKPEVAALLKKMVPVRIDATFNDKPEVGALLDKYKVIGWPTLLFIDSSGKVLKDLSVVSYNPELLLENIKKALGENK